MPPRNKPRPAWHQQAQTLAALNNCSYSILAEKFGVTKGAIHGALLDDADYMKYRERKRDIMRQLRGRSSNY